MPRSAVVRHGSAMVRREPMAATTGCGIHGAVTTQLASAANDAVASNGWVPPLLV